jgi:hypothetical protein
MLCLICMPLHCHPNWRNSTLLVLLSRMQIHIWQADSVSSPHLRAKATMTVTRKWHYVVGYVPELQMSVAPEHEGTQSF